MIVELLDLLYIFCTRTTAPIDIALFTSPHKLQVPVILLSRRI